MNMRYFKCNESIRQIEGIGRINERFKKERVHSDSFGRKWGAEVIRFGLSLGWERWNNTKWRLEMKHSVLPTSAVVTLTFLSLHHVSSHYSEAHLLKCILPHLQIRLWEDAAYIIRCLLPLTSGHSSLLIQVLTLLLTFWVPSNSI